MGKVAFVYPGSGNDFPGMGRELAVQWPDVLRRQDAENERLRRQFVASMFWDDAPTRAADSREKIFAQVALGGLTTDLMQKFGVRPDAAIGYSLGESAALFALWAWAGRDAMLRAMNASTLFAGDLTGRCDAARRAWKLPPEAPVEWTAGLIVDRAPREVRAALAGLDRAYLLAVDAPSECVVGGHRPQVAEAARRLGARCCRCRRRARSIAPSCGRSRRRTAGCTFCRLHRPLRCAFIAPPSADNMNSRTRAPPMRSSRRCWIQSTSPL